MPAARSASPSNQPDCRVAVLTPVGRGAIATIAVEGADAAAAVSRWFQPAGGKPLEQCPIRRILLGRWQGEGGAGEEVVVCRRSPVSVEIHCHGGREAAAAIADRLAAAGCPPIEQSAWAALREADPLAAEARVQLARAATLRTAAILLDQYRGALRRAAERIRVQLQRGDRAAAQHALEELETQADLGLHLTRPWSVVVAGPPNVGKSSLINALLGYRRALVHPQPGATRDVVTAETALDGWPVQLADTAGLRASDEPVEAEGVSRALHQIAAADLTLLVLDASQPAVQTPPACSWEKTTWTMLTIYNKCDLEDPHGRAADALRTSALTGEGIDRLIQEIVQRLAPHPPPAGAAVPFAPRHVEAVRSASRRAARGQMAEAAAAIDQLLKSPPS